MRKLESKKDTEKKKRRNQLIVGLVLVAVMLFSVLGYGFQSQDNDSSTQKNVEYNGFTFIPNGMGYYSLQIGNAQFLFKNTPKDINKTNSNLNLVSNYANKPLYVYSESQNAEIEIYRNLDGFLLRRQYACLDLGNNTEIKTNATTNCEENMPIKTCSDNFLIIEKGENIELTQYENCIFIRAPEPEMVAASDEFLFQILDIR